MATTTKKGSKNKKAKPRRPVVKTSVAEQAQTIAELRQQLEDRDQQLADSAKELQDCKRQLTESLEQQTATSEILGVIASSPTDIQPVLDIVAANAARLCEATDARVRLVEGDGTRLVASFGTAPAPEFIATSPRHPGSRAILERQTVHIDDLRAVVENEFPENADTTQRTGTRTFLSTPMLREGTPIGLIQHQANRGSSFLRQTNQIAGNLCFAGRNRHRERPAVQRDPGTQFRIARGPRAPDGDGRSAQHHQPLAHRRAAGPRCYRGERGEGLWNR